MRRIFLGLAVLAALFLPATPAAAATCSGVVGTPVIVGGTISSSGSVGCTAQVAKITVKFTIAKKPPGATTWNVIATANNSCTNRNGCAAPASGLLSAPFSCLNSYRLKTTGTATGSTVSPATQVIKANPALC